MFNTDYFLQQVDLSGIARDGRFSDAEILQVAYYQFISVAVPLILSLREEYYVTSETQIVTKSVASYPIPYRAQGLSLREVKLLDGNKLKDLYRIEPTAITDISEGTPVAFYPEAQDVVLYPTPNSTTGLLKLSYFLTPNVPVLLSQCAQITSIDRDTGIITATGPSSWVITNKYDFISAKNGHKTISADQVASAVSPTSLTFPSIPATLAVGDYIALAGQAPFFQCPDSVFQYLVQLTVSELLTNMNDTQALQVSKTKEATLMNIIQASLSNRVVGAPKRFSIQGF